MNDIAAIEKRLWSVADDLRANSGLASNEYFLPIMGLIFLRHAYSRFHQVRVEIEPNLPSRKGVKRKLTREDFSQRSAIFLSDNAQFPYLVSLPTGADCGKKIVEAMEAIERDYPSLTGVLPKQEYVELSNDNLGSLLRTFNIPELERVSGDVFGRIYEYFLTKFADQKAHDNGEFFTPPSIVQTIVNMIEPNHGDIIDPACGSGGMFVQSAHFIEQMKANPNEKVTFYGMEKSSTTIRLAKMNLAVHGLEGNIAEANSYYMDPHDLVGKADFVMANPPFNVDEIDSEKIKTDPRMAFGLPGVNKAKKISNGNYVWMSIFHSYLSAKGRAGIVMSSQASSSGGNEAKVRQAMIKTGDVDVMIAIRNNFFYTRTVPCELWFFDRSKPTEMRDKVLMIDARQIFNKVTRKIYDFTPEQQKNMTSIVWLYRGQNKRFIDLVAEYLTQAVETAAKMPLSNFRKAAEIVLEGMLHTTANNQPSEETLKDVVHLISKTLQCIVSDAQSLAISADLSALKTIAETASDLADQAKDSITEIDHFYKQTLALNNNEKDRRKGKNLKAMKALAEARELLKDALKSFRTLCGHANWLLTRFPNAKLVDVEGLVKLVDHAELEANDWSLTPGRYVGVAPEIEDEDFDFEEELAIIYDELEFLNSESKELATQVAASLKSFLS